MSHPLETLIAFDSVSERRPEPPAQMQSSGWQMMTRPRFSSRTSAGTAAAGAAIPTATAVTPCSDGAGAMLRPARGMTTPMRFGWQARTSRCTWCRPRWVRACWRSRRRWPPSSGSSRQSSSSNGVFCSSSCRLCRSLLLIVLIVPHLLPALPGSSQLLQLLPLPLLPPPLQPTVVLNIRCRSDGTAPTGISRVSLKGLTPQYGTANVCAAIQAVAAAEQPLDARAIQRQINAQDPIGAANHSAIGTRFYNFTPFKITVSGPPPPPPLSSLWFVRAPLSRAALPVLASLQPVAVLLGVTERQAEPPDFVRSHRAVAMRS